MKQREFIQISSALYAEVADMMKEDAIVEIEFLLKREDGSVCGVGNSAEISRGEAAKLIEAKEAKALEHPVGVVPPEWGLRGKKTEAVEEVKE